MNMTEPEGNDHRSAAPFRPALEQAPAPWVLHFVRRYTSRLALVAMLALPAVGLGLVQPYLTKILIDDGLLAGRFDVVLWTVGAFFAVAVVLFAIGALHRWLYIDVSSRILFDMRESVFRHLLTLSPRFFHQRRKGDILSRIDGDIAEVQRFATDTLLMLFNNVLVLVGALALMISLSGRLALLAFVLLPAQVFFCASCAAGLKKRCGACAAGSVT